MGTRSSPSRCGDVVVVHGVEEPAQLAGARGQALHAGQPCLHARVVGARGRDLLEIDAGAPDVGDSRPHRLAPGGVVGPVDVVAGDAARHRRVEDDRLHALGRQRGHGHRQQPATRVAHEHGALAAGGVEDGKHVARLVLKRQLLAAGIRQPASAAVHDQQPAEAHEALEEAGEPRLLPEVLDVRDEAGDEEQVGRGIAGRRPRDGGVPVARVAGLDLHPVVKPTDARSRAGALRCVPPGTIRWRSDERWDRVRPPGLRQAAPDPRSHSACASAAVSRRLGNRLRVRPEPGGEGIHEASR